MCDPSTIITCASRLCRLALGSRDLFTISTVLASLSTVASDESKAVGVHDQLIFLTHGSLFPAPPSPSSAASQSDQKAGLEVVGRVCSFLIVPTLMF